MRARLAVVLAALSCGLLLGGASRAAHSESISVRIRLTTYRSAGRRVPSFSEQLIRLAEKSPALAGLQPWQLFPHDIGAASCTIPAGGFVRGRKLSGLCGVTMKNVWSKPAVSFTEDWPSGTGETERHIWHVVLHAKRVVATTQNGPVPPQLQR